MEGFFSSIKKAAGAAVRVATAPQRAIVRVLPKPLRTVASYATGAGIANRLLAASKRAPSTPIARPLPFMRGSSPVTAPSAAPVSAWGGVFSRVATAVNASAPSVLTPAFYAAPPTAVAAQPYQAPAYAAPAPAAAPASWGGGGDGGAGGGYYDGGGEYSDELPELPEGEGDEDADLGDIDYGAYFDGSAGGLGDFSDDLKKIGVELAKGAASGVLTSAAGALTGGKKAAPLIAPPPAGMSTPAKIAIGIGVGVPLIYMFTRHRGGAASATVVSNPRRRRRRSSRR